jgi:hypothetical protein
MLADGKKAHTFTLKNHCDSLLIKEQFLNGLQSISAEK